MQIIKNIVVLILAFNTLHAITFEEQFQKGNDAFLNNQHDTALTAYKEAIALNNNCQQAYFNTGLVYAHQNNHQRALEAYLKAIEICPTYLKAYVQAGNSYQTLNLFDKAIEMFQKGLALDQNSFDCIVGLARALNNASKFEDSITAFERTLKHKPDDTGIMLELANTLNLANHTEQALALYHRILQSIPENPSILYNIAYTLKKLNRIDEALPIYQKVLALEPSNAEAHFSLGLAYLTMGDFERGWQEYEWRWKRDNHGGPRVLSKPLWNGSSLDNKTLFLHAEQGLGDTFQFIRYAKELKDRYTVHIILACQDPAIQIMKLCPYIDQVVSLFEKVPMHDVQAPLLSIPYLMKTRLDSVPHTIPYLCADQTLVKHWHAQLDHTKFNVGICWQGNANYSTHFLRTAVAAKSMNAAQFMPLCSLENVMVYNLQKVTGEDQSSSLNVASFISFDKDFDATHGRFMDTAALIKNLDLVITIDTSIAHLAAGLGTPTWILLPEPADWRWMINRNDTPWYPNVRLFRQPSSGDWQSVMHVIVNELKKMVALSAADQSIKATKNKIHALELQKTFGPELAQLSWQLRAELAQRRVIVHNMSR